MHVTSCFSLSICFPQYSTITKCIYQPVRHLSSFPLFFSITIRLWVGQIPNHINFLGGFAFVYGRKLLCLTIRLIPCVFPNRQYGFTLLPDGCQRWNYASLRTGKKKTLSLRQSVQANLNFFPCNVLPKRRTGRNKQVEVVEAVIPWMLNGLSITKIPFHTTERSTGRSLMSLPS